MRGGGLLIDGHGPRVGGLWQDMFACDAVQQGLAT